MTLHPSFSVIVPVYGVERYIERCAESLFAQTYDNIQFIFVNDGTKDRSMELLRALIDTKYSHLKPRIVLVDKENAGLPAARKTGLEHAVGDYVLHVDSDDYLELSAVGKLASAAERTDADLIYFDLVKEYPARTSYKREKDYSDCGRDRFILNIINGKSMGYLHIKCFKRSVYTGQPIYFAPCGCYEDIYASIQLIWYSRTVFHLREYLYRYDRSNPLAHTLQDKRKRHIQFCENMLDLYKHFAPDLNGTPAEVAGPSLLFRVAWYTWIHKLDYFKSEPWFAEAIVLAPCSTNYYIPVAVQLILKLICRLNVNGRQEVKSLRL